MAWLAYQAVRHPEIHARQFDAEAPLWIPMLLFVLVCTTGAVFLFLRAAKRMDSGALPPNNASPEMKHPVRGSVDR